MTLTLDLPPDLEARLTSEAARRGLSPADYLLELVRSATPEAPSSEPSVEPDETEDLLGPWPEDEPRPTTPAEVVAYWEREGVLGIWADRTDIPDSPEYARQLRRQAEQHGRDQS
jgi:hypothetical protein